MKSRILVFILFTISISLIRAQTDFRPGYIITNNFDTIQGLIDYRGDIRNASVCVFKTSISTEPITYYPADIHGYRFIDGKYYISRIITKEENEVRLFLEYLVHGIADLYYYRDNTGDHYLIEKEGENFVELTSEQVEIYRGNKKYLKESKRYIGLLKATFSDCQEILPEIDNVKLKHNDLINITSDYHTLVCEGEDCIIYEKKPPVVSISVAPLLGFNYSKIKFLIFDIYYEDIYSDIDLDSDYSLIGGVSLNILSPRLNEKISFQVDVVIMNNYFYAFSKQENTITNEITYNDIHIHLSTLKTSLLLKYTFPKGKIKPSAFIGLVGDFRLKSDNHRVLERQYESTVHRYDYTDIPLGDNSMGVQTGIGINYMIDPSRILSLQCYYEYLKGNYSSKILSRTNNIGLRLGMYFAL